MTSSFKAIKAGTTRPSGPMRMLTATETASVAGGLWCSYAPALVAIRLMTGVDFGSFVCDDGTTR
jgi:hypothetical protein